MISEFGYQLGFGREQTPTQMVQKILMEELLTNMVPGVRGSPMGVLVPRD